MRERGSRIGLSSAEAVMTGSPVGVIAVAAARGGRPTSVIAAVVSIPTAVAAPRRRKLTEGERSFTGAQT